MKKLYNFLERFIKLTPPDHAVRNAVVAATKEVIGLTLTHSSIEVQKKVIYINTKPVIKSEILLHKKEILSAVENKLGKTKTVADIH